MMNNCKLYAIAFFLFLGLQQSFAQNYKFRSSGFSVLEKNERGKWGNWSDLKLVTVSISLDTEKNRFVVYLPLVQLFEIAVYEPTEENESDIVYSFVCKDTNGEDCLIAIITRKKQDNRKQLYITYKDRIIVYNIVNAQ